MKKMEGFKNEKIIICPKSIIDSLIDEPLIKNLYVTDIGIFYEAKDHFVNRVKPIDEYILIFCNKGEGFFVIDNVRYILKKNEALIIKKNVIHSYGSSSINPWTIFWLHFSGENIAHYISSENKFNIFTLTMDETIIFKFNFNLILEYLERGITKNNLIISFQFLNALISFITFNNSNLENIVNHRDRYLNTAITFLKNNINRTITLDELAKAIYLSKSHTSLIFKDYTGYSPIDFFIRLKIQNACVLLKYSNKTIKEISKIYGYNDPYYFSRIFKKVVSLSPLEYRNTEK